ncbi:hypothetical protein NEAUS04_2441 [Nematocida ausubeli]|uniref:Uncharacterized protein n=1 Tax=Nematocida ausubeli (strain ATCC PRA-371 / ERTm2) TaxID=1913371 RepID=H8ZAW8_NEMA1|nr:uncharacterized protein NESG_01431 [Nematocida ausubeli]EHY66021.1 hypothetical protein NERG_00717 [Nematocida ausubeli]KAI5132550.1 hypothetical protein NEAUS06_0199 [Nematocida ausubeli]KAI5138710.1 hypothetical protein NEAUS07_2454 [Nematocida ausubeli]KAI5138718.1 hypothetical protein NEAUS07_2460 [Nematocida ausubeli]KAI5151385.1 hypothetical protein NEAUS05_2477 [Nematocida ausubeli]
MKFTGEKLKKVKGVFTALSSVIDETLHIGPLAVMDTDVEIITKWDFGSSEL